MDIQQTAQELQKFADAHSLNTDVSVILDNMDAGDYVTLNAAIDNSDNREIMQLLQKYKARFSESYSYFGLSSYDKHLSESDDLKAKVDAMTATELHEQYKKNYTYSDVSMLSTQEMKTIVYEDYANQLKTSNIAQMNNIEKQQQVNPLTQAKLKQAELERNTNNVKVTVPGNQSGTDDVETVVGVDPGQNPQQSLVVTKNNSKPNEVNVFSLDDVTPITSQSSIREDISPAEQNEEVMGGEGQESAPNPDQASPLTHVAPGMGEMIHAISDIEKEDDIYGDDSVMGNTTQHENDAMVDQIIDFCNRMRGR